MLTPDITTLWVVGFLLLCTYLLNSLVFQPILRVIDERATAVRGAKELAESSAQKATAAAAEYDRTLNTARAEVYRQMDDMRRVANDERARLLDDTRAEAQAALAEATAKLQADTARARADLRADAEKLGNEAAGRILGRQAS